MSKEMVGGCCVCSDERGWPDNPLVYCDGSGCTVAVHQACYGIVTVPTGPWYCRKCESPETKGKARCALCPVKSGALKSTDTGGWAHVVCALYIPEVRFASVTSMEPIMLALVPPERFQKKCCICEESGKPHRATVGACMQCNKPGCRQQFHVTCAQINGLLCEEAGNFLDNVKYCGYCHHHYGKLKRSGNVKTVPPYKPLPEEGYSSDSPAEEEPEPAAATDQHQPKAKGPGRKRSHSSGSAKSSVASSKAHQPQPMDKKKSPARRGSSAGEGGGSKHSTPAPSPQHSTESPLPVKGGSSQLPPGKSVAPEPQPPGKAAEPVGVISSLASATTAPAPASALSTSVTTSPPAPVSLYQESVITNTGAMDTKQTKKRKAVVAAAQAAAAAAEAAAAAAAAAAATVEQTGINAMPELAAPHQTWDQKDDYDLARKITKRAKPAEPEATGPYPPAAAPHWPRSPSPRHRHSPLAGPSGMNPPAPTAPSPSQQHSQVSMEAGAAHAAQALHAHSRAAWGGLNVQYEQQHLPQDKPGSSGMGGTSKDASAVGAAPLPPASIRNKKRAAMAAASNQPLPPPASPIQMAPSSQSLASVRRPPQPTPPPAPLYTETVQDSPPASPGDRGVKKPDQTSMYRVPTAHHMLGNELNPESVVADRLQEQLTAEMAAHEAGAAGAEPLVPPPLINKAVGASTSGAQSLDQLLERHWEQGSQFLMEQAQHFDIASLLSCLHQLRTENSRLQDTVSDLLHRRNHLLAVNGRLAIPLITNVGPPGRENGAPPPARPPRPETATSGHHSVPDQRQHQHQRPAERERADERAMRLPESAAHVPSHSRTVNMDTQMTMRDVQQKPS